MENIDKKKIVLIAGFIIVFGIIIIAIIFSIKNKSLQTEEKTTNSSPFGDMIYTGNKGSTQGVVTSIQKENEGSTNSAIDNTNNYNPLVKLSKERSSGVGFAVINETKLIDEELKTPSESGATTTKKSVVVPVLHARYVERATGHVYDYNTETKETKKISNTTIPRTEESIFVSGGTKVIFRSLAEDGNTIESYLGTLPTGNITDKITGGNLPQNILSITKNKEGSEIFYITKNNLKSMGNILNVNNLQETRIFESPFTEWLAYWGDNGITLHTKASANFWGTSFLLNRDKSYNKIFGGYTALTAKESNKDGLIPLSFNTKNVNNFLAIYNTKTNNIINTNIYTISEKCVWWNESFFLICAAPREAQVAEDFIDSWYKGLTFTSDDLYLINPETGIGVPFAYIDDLMKTKTELDIVNMEVSPDDNYLLFLDKRTGNPWILNMTKAAEYISE